MKNDSYRDSKTIIYLSRDRYTQRDLVIRKDLDSLLQGWRLTKVYKSDLSLTEQVCQLRDGDMIVTEAASWACACHVAENVRIVG